MVKHHTYTETPEIWVEHFKRLRGDKDAPRLQTALGLYTADQQTALQRGLGIADILLSLGLDSETVTLSLLYPALQSKALTLDVVSEIFGLTAKKLLQDVLQMQSLGNLQHLQDRGPQQIENLRKMLLAMIKDVRAVLVVLAERLWLLRQAKKLNVSAQQALARETMDVHAPLANRLGIWQLKWEMEDLCLRYLQPEIYMKVAKWLASRRQEREEYIQGVLNLLTQMLHDVRLQNFQVSGRVKHIYSIYKKMQRKGASFDAIYDISALRVLVPTINDCYTVLGLLQNTWAQVPEEFDDYISQPKANGYRSIHIVVKGPEERFVEVQIRTYEMHQESELGVAAHWRYKEGVLQPSTYEAKIALLRQIMAWQKEVATGSDVQTEQEISPDLLSERVYVFTPLGDIIDLPEGATPLDFAYHIHSELGHRCRGAKINGNIVPITYALQTGERVEILTAKEANPSRDWLNPHYGYLKTPRARAKVQHWFRIRDSEGGQAERDTLDKTTSANVPSTASSLPIIPVSPHRATNTSSQIHIQGVDNLLTKIAFCCKPLPGDDILGYITQARGVSIHRRDCKNIKHMLTNHLSRIVEVNWGGRFTRAYPVDLQLTMYNRAGLLRDITTFLAAEKINVLGLQTTQVNAQIPEVAVYVTIEIADMEQLNGIIDQLQKIPNVTSVRRR